VQVLINTKPVGRKMEIVGRKLLVHSAWKPEAQLVLLVPDSAAKDLLGRPNLALRAESTTPALEVFSTLYLLHKLTDSASNLLLQLLDAQGNVVWKAYNERLTGKITIPFLQPGSYSLRIIEDKNRNGRADGGNLQAGTQPETVRILPDKLNLRAGWEVEFDLNPTPAAKP
jgi:hypothetical protein